MDCRLMHLKKFRQGNLRKLGGEGGGSLHSWEPPLALNRLPCFCQPHSICGYLSGAWGGTGQRRGSLRQCRADQAEDASWSHQGSQSPVLPAMRCERWGWAWPWFSGSSTSKMKGSFTHMMLHMKVSTKRGLNDVWRLQ